MLAEQIQRIYFKLEISERPVLSIMVSDSGAINRLGDGTLEDDPPVFFMGHTEEPIFQTIKREVDEDLLSMSGRYTLPDPLGDTCRMEIIIEAEAENTGFEFTYGSDSMGPPEEIVQLFEMAVELTHPWFEDQWNQKKQRRK